MAKHNSTENTIDLSKCKIKYQYLTDEDGKPYDIVSNIGLKKYEKCYVERNGEYHGFCIEAQEDIPSILTNKHVANALKSIKDGDLEKAASNINMYSNYQKYGEQILYYVIDKWLQINNFPKMFDSKIDKPFLKSIASIKKSVDNYVETQRHHPIIGKIKIVDIGTNTNTKEPVVPPEWVDRIFDSAEALHEEMNSLPVRKGKPPVCYCCIYSNSIKRDATWLINHKLKQSDTIFKVTYEDSIDTKCIYTEIIQVEKEIVYNEKILRLHNSNMFLQLDEKLLKKEKVCVKRDNVGYLSSLLQKCIRGGNHNGTLLELVIKNLNESPSYNLPDHNFASVSGSRQLLWRSYISILEDTKGYIITNKQNGIDMTSMVLLAIACHIDSNIQLSNECVDVVILTMKHMQAYDQIWNWRDYECESVSNIKLDLTKNDYVQITNSIALAIHNLPMMANDKNMLLKIYSYMQDLNKIDDLMTIKKNYSTLLESEQDLNEQQQTRSTAMDMHCQPTMLIRLQGMLNLSIILGKTNDSVSLAKYTPTLERLSYYIWDNFSRINFRISHSHTLIYSNNEIKKNNLDSNIVKKLDNNIYSCVSCLQDTILDEIKCNFKIQHEIHEWTKCDLINNYDQNSENDIPDSEKMIIGRTAWLLIFGGTHKFRYKSRVYDVFMGGTSKEQLLRVKKTVENKSEYVEGILRSEIQDNFLESISEKEITVKLHSPPENYTWNFKKGKTVIIKYDKDLDEFYVNGCLVECLNLYKNLLRIPKCFEHKTVPDFLVKTIKFCTYCEYDVNSDFGYDEDITCIMNDIIYCRRLHNDRRIFKWIDIVNNKISIIWRLVLARLYTSDIDSINGKFILVVGPCDRRGKKTNNSISAQFEGVLYRIFIMLEMIYPFMIKRIKHSMRWFCDKTLPDYYHMMNTLKQLCQTNKDKIVYEKDLIKIITPLWEHQEKTSEKLFRGITIDRKRGFGDASYVGAGKTLCALNTLVKLYNYNTELKENKSSGFLVMVPSIQLIKTWTDEIEKHTKGFDTYVQSSNGDFIRMNGTEKVRFVNIKINPNTIIISTMGRTRENPLQHSWIIVVIDECLSVQNKEALQTEEAWRQSCYSEYGIIMLSATFFRSRFDKMLYMLKMLKTGLPEEQTYLDAILNETIVSNITESDRVWKIVTSKIKLTGKQQQKYEKIYRENSNKGSEMLYLALNKYIHENIDYVDIFYDQLEKLEKYDHSVVIFAKSKLEANKIVESKRNTSGNVTRYPEKGIHTVVSLSEGTYGLNDLVIYNTILMRPPEPDKLPQIKGRLDRPGQTSKELHIRYVLLKDTIEEAFLIRLELCNKFYNNYLMPLAEFYDTAVAIKPKSDVDNSKPVNNITNVKNKC